MTLRDAIDRGLVHEIVENGHTRRVTPDGDHVLWHDDSRHLPWRLAQRVWPDDGRAGQFHQGFGSLRALLRWVYSNTSR